MPEIKHKVRGYEVNYRCDLDICQGEMIATGKEREDHSDKYQHECNYCNIKKWLNKKYPYTETDPFN